MLCPTPATLARYVPLFLTQIRSHPPFSRSIFRIWSALMHGFSLLDFRLEMTPHCRLLLKAIARLAPCGREISKAPLLPHHIASLAAHSSPSDLASSWRLTVLSLGLFLGLRPAEVGLIALADLQMLDGAFRIRFRRVKARLFQKWDVRLISSIPVLTALRS